MSSLFSIRLTLPWGMPIACPRSVWVSCAARRNSVSAAAWRRSAASISATIASTSSRTPGSFNASSSRSFSRMNCLSVLIAFSLCLIQVLVDCGICAGGHAGVEHITDRAFVAGEHRDNDPVLSGWKPHDRAHSQTVDKRVRDAPERIPPRLANPLERRRFLLRLSLQPLECPEFGQCMQSDHPCVLIAAGGLVSQPLQPLPEQSRRVDDHTRTIPGAGYPP